MANQDTADRLRNRAAGKTEPKRGQPGSVQGFVRRHLDVIREVKDKLSWDEIAEEFARDGLRWKNGNFVTGRDLRTIFSKIGGKADQHEPAAMDADKAPVFSGTRAGRSVSDNPVAPHRTGNQISKTSGEKSKPEVPVQAGRGTTPSKSNDGDRERILREMARAAAERDKKVLAG